MPFMLRPLLILLLAAAPFLSSLAEPPLENTAIVPAGRLENDFYDWDQRHAAIMAVKDTLKPEIVLIGDSITHMGGGPPEETSGRGNRGLDAWKVVFGERPVLNL